MSILRHLFAWLAATAFCALLVPVLSPAGAIVERIDHWHHQLERDLGAASGARLAVRSQACALAVHKELNAWQPAKPDARANQARPTGSVAQSAGEALASLACVRAVTLTAWLSVLCPFWFGAAVQGWVVRDIGRERFAARNPLAYRACLQGAIALSGTALVAMVVPVDFPLGWIPAVGVLFAVLLMLAVVHRPSWAG